MCKVMVLYKKVHYLKSYEGAHLSLYKVKRVYPKLCFSLLECNLFFKNSYLFSFRVNPFAMPYGLFHPGFSTSGLFLLCTIEDSNFLGSALGNRNVSGIRFQSITKYNLYLISNGERTDCVSRIVGYATYSRHFEIDSPTRNSVVAEGRTANTFFFNSGVNKHNTHEGVHCTYVIERIFVLNRKTSSSNVFCHKCVEF